MALHECRILFTDNWYTSMALATAIWEQFSMLFVGTMSLTNKGCRTSKDFTFDKLSGSAQRQVERGWFRRAVRSIPSNRNSCEFVLQATIWMDRKLVGFLHSAQVTTSDNHSVQRWSRTEKKKVDVVSPPVTWEYSDCMGDFDMNDGDGANYSISIRSTRWYLRLFCWTLERAIHANFQLTVVFANGGSDGDSYKEKWKGYTSKNGGRFNFQIDLVMLLIEYGIRLDWKGDPAWIRQVALVPCDCGSCFFCKTGRTTGVSHKPSHRTKKNVVPRGHARKREKVAKSGRLCKLCYAKNTEKHKGMSSAEKRKRTVKSQLGCLRCNTCVCAGCWHLFQHANNNNN